MPGDFGDAVKRVVRLAYPNAGAEVADNLVTGLCHKELRKELPSGTPPIVRRSLRGGAAGGGLLPGRRIRAWSGQLLLNL